MNIIGSLPVLVCHMTADPSQMHGKSRRSLKMQLLCVLLCCLVAACHGANITVGTVMNSG